MLRHWQAASSQQTRMGRQRLWSTLTLSRSNNFSWHEIKVKIMSSWRIDLVCSEAEVCHTCMLNCSIYVFFIFYFMAQTEFLYYHSPHWHKNSMLLLIFSWANYQNFNLFFTEYQGKAMMQNHCVPLSKLFFYLT